MGCEQTDVLVRGAGQPQINCQVPIQMGTFGNPPRTVQTKERMLLKGPTLFAMLSVESVPRSLSRTARGAI